jgi:D-lactate dehydrogenase
MQMKICFFESGPDEEAYLAQRLPDDDLQFIPKSLPDPSAIHHPDKVEAVSPFVHMQIGRDVIDMLPNLKLITTRSTGHDHVDVGYAKQKGIFVSNVPTYGENTVAEHTFSLILALSRNVHKAWARTLSGDFSLEGLRGFDLNGKTIGVVGTGHIGLFVVKIAKGFGMNVIAYDPYPNLRTAEIMGFTYTELNDLLNQSDIVTLHAPLTPGTHHMIGQHNIGQFKKGALLINTSRGALIDTEALLRGLDEKILAGAGLDVLEGEEIFSEEKQLLGNPEASNESLKTALRNLSLLRRPNLVITPHIAFDSQEAVERILDTTIGNINAYRRGSPRNLV